MSPVNFAGSIGFNEIAVLLAVLVVGIIIVLVLKALIHFLLPIIAAVAVYYFTSSFVYAALAFVAVAILELILRRK